MDSEIIIAVITGLTSSVATIAVIKNDIKWLKLTLLRLDERVTELEKKYGNEKSRTEK